MISSTVRQNQFKGLDVAKRLALAQLNLGEALSIKIPRQEYGSFGLHGAYTRPRDAKGATQED